MPDGVITHTVRSCLFTPKLSMMIHPNNGMSSFATGQGPQQDESGSLLGCCTRIGRHTFSIRRSSFMESRTSSTCLSGDSTQESSAYGVSGSAYCRGVFFIPVGAAPNMKCSHSHHVSGGLGSGVFWLLLHPHPHRPDRSDWHADMERWQYTPGVN